jgi:hypothetical protein
MIRLLVDESQPHARLLKLNSFHTTSIRRKSAIHHEKSNINSLIQALMDARFVRGRRGAFTLHRINQCVDENRDKNLHGKIVTI